MTGHASKTVCSSLAFGLLGAFLSSCGGAGGPTSGDASADAGLSKDGSLTPQCTLSTVPQQLTFSATTASPQSRSFALTLGGPDCSGLVSIDALFGSPTPGFPAPVPEDFSLPACAAPCQFSATSTNSMIRVDVEYRNSDASVGDYSVLELITVPRGATDALVNLLAR